MGIPYDSRRGPRDRGGAHGDHVRPRLRGERRDGRRRRAPFAGYAKNREPMLARDGHAPRRGLRRSTATTCPNDLCRAACEDWDDAVQLGEQHGYRNAQATVLAPTGTIGLLMDCDTTGIEPDFALVKFKKLAGGGYFKIVNQSVPERAAARSATARAQIAGDRRLRQRHEHAARRAARQPRARSRQRGLTDAELAKVEAALPGVFELDQRVRAVGPRRGDATSASAITQGARAARGLLAPRAPRLHAGRDRRGERHDHRSHDDRGRAAPQAEHYAGVRLREPLRQDGQALPRADVPRAA